MAPHSSVLAWRIPWTEEPGGLQSMGSLKSDTTERLHVRFSLSGIGEGNGTPLQCSCLENPRAGGAWWAAVYGWHRVGHDWSDSAAAVAVFHYICICTRHIFIHFSVDGYLVCFHVLAIVNSAAMSIKVHVSFQSMFFSIGSLFVCFLSLWVYYSARATLKKDHKLSGLKNKKFIFS